MFEDSKSVTQKPDNLVGQQILFFLFEDDVRSFLLAIEHPLFPFAIVAQ